MKDQAAVLYGLYQLFILPVIQKFIGINLLR